MNRTRTLVIVSLSIGLAIGIFGPRASNYAVDKIQGFRVSSATATPAADDVHSAAPPVQKPSSEEDIKAALFGTTVVEERGQLVPEHRRNSAE
jgi:hypothetical protein